MTLAAKLITVTGILIAIYLIVNKASDVSGVFESLGNVYVNAVRALQGN